MTMLRLLALGAGLGSIYVCSKEAAATADVGCAINCADFTMRYPRGVKPFWLHIAYHGRLDGTHWQDRVMGAMRMVLGTLLEGKDVVVHCAHGPHGKKVCSRSTCLSQLQSKAWNISKVPGPWGIRITAHILFFPRQTSFRLLLHPLAHVLVRGPRSSSS